MQNKKRKLQELVIAKTNIEKEITILKEYIQNHVILENLDELCNFPDGVFNLMNDYYGQKQCFECKNLFPIAIENCLFCISNKNQKIQLQGKLTDLNKELMLITFTHVGDEDVWNYCTQFAERSSLMYDYWDNSFREATHIFIAKTTFLENGSNRIYISVKLATDFPQVHESSTSFYEKTFYEICKKYFESSFRTLSFTYPQI
jgi:hypothetical protein